MQPLRVVHQTGEDDHTEHQEEHEKGELLGASLERVYEDLEAGRVAGELEQPEDADDGEELQDVRVLHVLTLGRILATLEGGYVVHEDRFRLSDHN